MIEDDNKNNNEIEIENNNENLKNTDIELIKNMNSFANDNIIRNSNEILFERDSNLNDLNFRNSEMRFTQVGNDEYSMMDNTKSEDKILKDDSQDSDKNSENKENNNENINDENNLINDNNIDNKENKEKNLNNINDIKENNINKNNIIIENNEKIIKEENGIKNGNNNNIIKNNVNNDKNFSDDMVIIDKESINNNLILSQNFSIKKSFTDNIKKKNNNIKYSINSNYKKSVSHSVLNFKIILIGSSGVGKTSIFNRYLDNSFSEVHKCTISSTNRTKKISLDSITIAKLSIWDTSGEERFKAVTRQYFKDSNGVIIVYDVNDRKSYEDKQVWLDFAKSESLPNVVMMLVGNKTDLDNRNVSKDEAKKFCNENDLLYFEVSAKNGDNISLIFETIASEIDRKQKEDFDIEDRFMNQSNKGTLEIQRIINDDKKKKHCC